LFTISSSSLQACRYPSLTLSAKNRLGLPLLVANLKAMFSTESKDREIKKPVFTVIRAVPFHSELNSSHTHFCDKNHKSLRVQIEATARIFLACLCKISASKTHSLSEKTCYFFDQIGNYQLSRGLTLLSCYQKFGPVVIDFVPNVQKRMNAFKKTHQTEEKALYRIFGDEMITKWLQPDSLKHDVKKVILKRMEIDDCCLGMTVDFLRLYLLQLDEGKTSLEAIKAISSRYVKGAPDEAVLAQIFNAAYQYSLVMKMLEGNPNLKETCDELKSSGELLIGIAQKCGLIFEPVDLTGSLTKSWEHALAELPNAAFMISLYAPIKENKSGHAFGLVKGNEGYFIFDPGHGILFLNVQEAARALTIIATAYKADDPLMTFFRCDLASFAESEVKPETYSA
jgi:hypothetical protein